MRRLEQHKPFFKALADQSSQVSRRQLLLQATKDQINMLSEVILNLLKQNVSVDPSLMARLRKHKQILRQLRLRQHSVKKRRQMLMDAKGNQLFRDLHDLVCVCLNRP